MDDLIKKLADRPLISFENFIHEIRFPYFKRLTPNTKIEFSSPFVVLVGPNGSGKSSTLQALYGCPSGKNVAHYWFSTAIDPIEESGSEPYRYIYKYKPKSYIDFIEVAQRRTKRRDDPDYWESSRPLIRDGMQPMPEESKTKTVSQLRSATRWKKVNKNVVYIDFRSELSSFDKFFYFGEFSRTDHIKSKQDFLRIRSEVLKKHIECLEENNIEQTWYKKTTKYVKYLSDEKITWINRILQKNYRSAKIVKHDLFNNDGYSIIFENSDSKYSEAVAGSGEISVVNCVEKVIEAEIGTLILLDEPEVSLHPGAQKSLRDLLLHSIITKGCQVVMSTHSEHFVNGLANNSIKLFSYNSNLGTYDVINSCSPEQAFIRIGSNAFSNKRRVYVEDKLAKHVVEAAIQEIDSEILKNLEVTIYSGGAETIIKNMLLSFYFSSSSNQDFVLLDGDMIRRNDDKSEVEKIFKSDIPSSEYKNIDSIFLSQTGISPESIDLPLDGGNSNNSNQALDMKLNMLDIYHEKFKFLSIDTPEELVWEIVEGNEYLNVDKIKESISSGSYKSKFFEYSKIEYGDAANSDNIFNTQSRFLSMRNKCHPLWIELKESLKLILKAEELA